MTVDSQNSILTLIPLAVLNNLLACGSRAACTAVTVLELRWVDTDIGARAGNDADNICLRAVCDLSVDSIVTHQKLVISEAEVNSADVFDELRNR